MADPIVTVKQGQLKGLIDTDIDGNTYYKFKGIPYAKPPIGELRFKAPQPADPWMGVRDATKEGSPCLAIFPATTKVVGTEDCLYINVYTRELPKAGTPLKPVMAFIHGGGFSWESSSESLYGSRNLMTEDVVLVTFNYRLGIFGFLSSDDLSLEVPGNAGLKDQTLALKWIQENISSFNGDPNNVTLFGESAGSGSVHFQVISPTAKGLFHKACALSGTVLNPWAWGKKNMVDVGKLVNENISTDKEALDILMSLPEKEILQLALKITDNLFDFTKRRPFSPVVEKPNPTAFLTEDPVVLLSSGRFNQVPLINGFTSNEGLMIDSFKGGNDFETLWFLDTKEGSPNHQKWRSLINDFYFKDGITEQATYDINSDILLVAGIIQFTKLAAKVSRSPVYLYLFSYQMELPRLYLDHCHGMNIDTKKEGVCHAEDLAFLFSADFGSKLDQIDPKVLQDAKIGIKKVTKIFADFARTGNPHEKWEPVTREGELKYLDINVESELKIKPFPDRIEFWEKVFKEVSPIDVTRE